jgi:hypothetical protein
MKQKSVKDLPGYPFKDPYNGDFKCYDKQLTSFEGCPKVVKGDFVCSDNNLQSLQYCPQIVEGNFYCSHNKLQSLQYCPQIVKGDFYCSVNKLQSLQYCPQIVNGRFVCSGNKLQSLQNIHKYCKQIDGNLWAHGNPITSRVLGVMLIENIQKVKFTVTVVDTNLVAIEKIINTHLETDRDVYLCQDNLIKAGFAEFAQL